MIDEEFLVSDIDKKQPIITKQSHKVESKEEITKGTLYYEKCAIKYRLVDGVLEQISVIAKGSSDCKGTLKLTSDEAESLISYFNTEWKR